MTVYQPEGPIKTKFPRCFDTSRFLSGDGVESEEQNVILKLMAAWDFAASFPSNQLQKFKFLNYITSKVVCI